MFRSLDSYWYGELEHSINIFSLPAGHNRTSNPSSSDFCILISAWRVWKMDLALGALLQALALLWALPQIAGRLAALDSSNRLQVTCMHSRAFHWLAMAALALILVRIWKNDVTHALFFGVAAVFGAGSTRLILLVFIAIYFSWPRLRTRIQFLNQTPSCCYFRDRFDHAVHIPSRTRLGLHLASNNTDGMPTRLTRRSLPFNLLHWAFLLAFSHIWKWAQNRLRGYCSLVFCSPPLFGRRAGIVAHLCAEPMSLKPGTAKYSKSNYQKHKSFGDSGNIAQTWLLDARTTMTHSNSLNRLTWHHCRGTKAHYQAHPSSTRWMRVTHAHWPTQPFKCLIPVNDIADACTATGNRPPDHLNRHYPLSIARCRHMGAHDPMNNLLLFHYFLYDCREIEHAGIPSKSKTKDHLSPRLY